MSDWLHDPLRDRFTAIADLRDDSDWLDVRRRRVARRGGALSWSSLPPLRWCSYSPRRRSGSTASS